MVFPPMARRISQWASLIISSSACLILGACASPSLQNGVFRGDDVAFRVGPIPEHWASIETDQSDRELVTFAFRNPHNQATIGVAARCHRDGDDVPLRSLTQHLYVGFTNRETRSEQDLTLDGRAALRTEMSASLDGVSKDLTFVVLKKDGCVYDFWRVAPTASTDPEFDAFVGGFQVLSQ